MTTTVTETITHNPNVFVQEVNKARDSLHGIIQKYINWKDPLSDSLYEWGCTALGETSSEVQDERSMLVESSERVNTLMNSILRNPLTGSTWESPYIDQHGNLVEESVLESLKKTKPQALKSASPHEFAKSMMTWGANIQRLFQHALGQTAVAVSEPERRVAAQVFTYLTQLRASKLEEGQLQLQDKLQGINQALDTLEKNVKERVKEETQAHLRNAQEHSKMVQEKLQGLDQSYRSQLEASSSLIKHLDQDLKQEKEALDTLNEKSKKIARELEAEKQTTASLRNRVYHLEDRVEDLKDRGSCSIM